MSDFTIEQLEALKEGTTPGPWGHTSLGYEAEKYPVYGDVPGDEVALVRRQDWELVSAAPALVDSLIAEKREHQGLRSYLNDLRGAYGEEFDPSDEWEKGLEYAYKEVARELARILEDE